MIKKSPDFISCLDLSHWEKDVFYDRMHLDFIPDAIITKASEYKWKDATAKLHMAGAKSLGVVRGLYHFYRPHDLDAQINTFFEVAKEAGCWDGTNWLIELPPILDVEYTPNPKDPKDVRGNALAYEVKYMLDAFEKKTGLKPIIYTGKYYWVHLNNRLGQPPSWSKDYPLWVSAYPDEPDKHSKPYLQVGGWGDSWAIWQYSEAGRLPHAFPYDGVDLNIINPTYWATIKKADLPLPDLGNDPDSGANDENVLTYEQGVKDGRIKMRDEIIKQIEGLE